MNILKWLQVLNYSPSVLKIFLNLKTIQNIQFGCLIWSWFPLCFCIYYKKITHLSVFSKKKKKTSIAYALRYINTQNISYTLKFIINPIPAILVSRVLLNTVKNLLAKINIYSQLEDDCVMWYGMRKLTILVQIHYINGFLLTGESTLLRVVVIE